MTKRTKGQKPYESEHPTKFWMPDVSGHQRKGGHGRAAVVVNAEQKRELENQIKKLAEEIIEKEESGGEKLG